MTRINDAWNRIFAEKEILANINRDGIYEITANEIKRHHEPRLMTKFDYKSQLPDIFTENQLSIQPNSRGSYLIGRFDSYFSFPSQQSVPEIEFLPSPSNIESITPDNIFSEATGILCAYNSGIISSFLGEECSLTVMGRMSTGVFDYNISDSSKQNTWPITVRNSQCEIDAGFESASQFTIIEAKNENVSDFLIRQIYYPYRLWKNKLSKPTVPVFMTISDGIFSLYEFQFNNTSDYNSLELLTHRRFQLGTLNIELNDILMLLDRTPIVSEPSDIPFPQSDTFVRVIDLLQQIQTAGGSVTKEDITTFHSFDGRQADYYANAGRYLGMIDRQHDEYGSYYTLTSTASHILTMNQTRKHLALAASIIGHKAFADTTRLYLSNARRPSKAEVIEIMKRANLSNINSEETLSRRASTVLSWTDWIIELTNR